jgi:hypothetical protein
MNVLYAIMSYLLLETGRIVLLNLSMVPPNPAYAIQIFNTFVMIEIVHYLFFRTRVSLYYFHKFSICSTLLTICFISYNSFYFTFAIINTYFLFNLFLIFCFLFL